MGLSNRDRLLLISLTIAMIVLSVTLAGAAGVFTVPQGGTGAGSHTAGRLLKGNGTSPIQTLSSLTDNTLLAADGVGGVKSTGWDYTPANDQIDIDTGTNWMIFQPSQGKIDLRTQAGGNSLSVREYGASAPAFTIAADGRLEWSDGVGGTPDTFLDRLATDVLGITGGDTFVAPVLVGSQASGGDLTIQSTTHATKGNVRFGSADGMSYDETNVRLGIGPTAETNTVTINGTPLPMKFATHDEGASQLLSGAYFTHNATAGNAPIIAGFRSRGSGASPSIVQDRDLLAVFAGYGSDGDDYHSAGYWLVRVNGTPGPSDMPGALVGYTTSDGGTGGTARIIINDQGRVGIGAETLAAVGPVSQLHVSESTGAVETLSRNDTAVAANDLIGKLQWWSNDSTLTTQNAPGYIGMYAGATYSADAAPGYMMFAVTPNTVGASPLDKLRLEGNALSPAANDGTALGTTALQFSDVLLAEGAVINFDNGDATITQTGDSVEVAGAVFTVNGLKYKRRALASAGTTITIADSLVVLTSSSGSHNFTLPSPATAGAGWSIYIRDESYNLASGPARKINIVRAGSEKIDNVAADTAISSDGGYWHAYTNGTDWFTLDSRL